MPDVAFVPNGGLRIGVTMREVHAPDYHEPRDALARDWAHFLRIAIPEAAWLPIPNLGAEAAGLFCAQWGINGLVLTGGDDFGVVPVRDETEYALFQLALSQAWPVFGVCRGLQLIWQRFGGDFQHQEGHCAVRHRVQYVDEVAPGLGTVVREVNSYHRYGLPGSVSTLREPAAVFGYADDGTIEGVSFRQGRVAGVMWHPEREQVPHPLDVALIRRLFGL